MLGILCWLEAGERTRAVDGGARWRGSARLEIGGCGVGLDLGLGVGGAGRSVRGKC